MQVDFSLLNQDPNNTPIGSLTGGFGTGLGFGQNQQMIQMKRQMMEQQQAMREQQMQAEQAAKEAEDKKFKMETLKTVGAQLQNLKGSPTVYADYFKKVYVPATRDALGEDFDLDGDGIDFDNENDRKATDEFVAITQGVSAGKINYETAANGLMAISAKYQGSDDLSKRAKDMAATYYGQVPKPTAPQAIDPTLKREIAKAQVSVAKTKPLVDGIIKEIDRVQLLNKESYGGLAGQAQMKARRATGLGDESKKFKNTADVVNTMQSQVARVLKSTFGGQLSDGERQYLNEVYGALAGLSPTERDIAMTNVKTMLKARLEGDEGTLQELLATAGIDYVPQGGGGRTSFATVEDAEAANLPPGTKITIGGRPATVE
jgi:hypothetical protein